MSDFDKSRLYFPAPAPTLVLVDAWLLGPLSPEPNASLADAVRRIAYTISAKVPPLPVAEAGGISPVPEIPPAISLVVAA